MISQNVDLDPRFSVDVPIITELEIKKNSMKGDKDLVIINGFRLGNNNKAIESVVIKSQICK